MGIVPGTTLYYTLESLRRPEENHIQNAIDFYDFTKEKFKNIHVEFIPSSVISELNDNILKERFQLAKTIKGTLGYHTFQSINGSHSKIKVKKFGLSPHEEIVSVSKSTE